MNNYQDKVTEVGLRHSIAVALGLLVFMGVLFTLPDLLRPAFQSGYKRSALIIAIGFAAGMAVGFWLTRLLQSLTHGSLTIALKSWHLNVGLGILVSVWTGIPALLAWSCPSLLEHTTDSHEASTAAMDCLVNAWMVARFTDGVILGGLIWTYLWAVVQERSRKGQLIVAVQSRKRWSIRGWPVTDTVMILGFGLFLMYIFYRIFTLK
jgi:hypothetical protein